MPKPREELRRGLRALIERTSHEMEALGDPSPADPEPQEHAPDVVVGERSSGPEAAGAGADSRGSTTEPAPAPGSDSSSRPMLRLVRNTVRTLIGTREDASPATAATAPLQHQEILRDAGGAAQEAPVGDVDMHFVHPRRGVCESYYVSHACWEVPDAYCNHALHTCMLRDCPVYNLHREELEKRFASRYSHLW